MKKSINKIRTIGEIAYIALYNRKNNVIAITIFDSKFINKVKDFRWSRYKHRNTWYVVTNIPRGQQKEYGQKRIKIHQIILPCKKPFMIDHKNHDGLDNRLDNLRIVTNRTNCENRGKRRNKFGLVGINYHKRDKVFVATIQINGKAKHVGNFKTKEEAHQARKLYKLANNL